MIVTIGRLVHYTLSDADCEQINRRRTTRESIAGAIRRGEWTVGSQAHVGVFVEAGMILPMIVCAVISNVDPQRVSGQVFLDGTDVFWTQANEGDSYGQWLWPMKG